MKEHELNQTAKQFLLDQGCTEVHGEVLNIDLVGKRGSNILYAMELKTSLSLKVLEQAYERKKYAHYVYIGVPKDKVPTLYGRLSVVHRCFLENNGIGLVALDTEEISAYDDNRVYCYYNVLCHSKLNRQPLRTNYLFNKLNETTLNKKGGMTSYERFSPYKNMIEKVIIYLELQKPFKTEDYQWTSVEKILNNVKEVKRHYANPRASLNQALKKFHADQVEYTLINGKTHFRIRHQNV